MNYYNIKVFEPKTKNLIRGFEYKEVASSMLLKNFVGTCYRQKLITESQESLIIKNKSGQIIPWSSTFQDIFESQNMTCPIELYLENNSQYFKDCQLDILSYFKKKSSIIIKNRNKIVLKNDPIKKKQIRILNKSRSRLRFDKLHSDLPKNELMTSRSLNKLASLQQPSSINQTEIYIDILSGEVIKKSITLKVLLTDTFSNFRTRLNNQLKSHIFTSSWKNNEQFNVYLNNKPFQNQNLTFREIFKSNRNKTFVIKRIISGNLV